MGIDKKPSKLYKLKKSKKKTILVLAMATLILSGIIINKFNKENIYNNKIAKNIYIDNIDVSNMTKQQALDKINKKVYPSDLSLIYKQKTFKIKAKDINLSYNTKDIVEKAYNYTKTGNYIENVKRYFELKDNEKEFNISAKYDEPKLSEKLQNISKDININTIDAKVYISDNGVISTSNSTTGKELDIANTKDKILNNIKNKNYNKINLNVVTKPPNIKSEDANSINTILGEFTTKFSAKATGRVHNIKVASNKNSNVVLMPGQLYSYNEHTGARNKSNGYEDAPVIVNGKLEDALGGGVCQVSTTLYNAVLQSGLELDAVTNHSLLSTYVPIGRDSMVNDLGTDLKFKNPYKHPVYIKTIVDNSNVTCRIYGNDKDKKNIDIYVDAFKEKGLDASKTYRLYKDKDGNVIKKQYIHKSVYNNPKK